jgi:phage terminase Nu1 subunit (DNA packaging protein)
MAPDSDSVTATELAEFIGVSPRSVTELGRRGIAVRAGPGRWRLRESVRRYCNDLRERGGGVAVQASAAAERGRLAKEQADALALKNARLRASLLDAEAVEREWADILRMVRSGVLATPSRIGASLPHLSAHDLAVIDRELRAALTALGNDESARAAHELATSGDPPSRLGPGV